MLRAFISGMTALSLAAFFSGCGNGTAPHHELRSTTPHAAATGAADATPPRVGSPHHALQRNVSSSAEPLTDRRIRKHDPMSHPEPRHAERGRAAEMGHRRQPEADVQRQPQHITPQSGRAGTLTAGSLDDHAQYAEFQSYLRRSSLAAGQQRVQPLLAQRVLISVADPQGRGISDARVRLRSRITDDVIFHTRTGSDGRAVFFSNGQTDAGESEFLLEVSSSDGVQTVSDRVDLHQSPWSAVLPLKEHSLPGKLDLALVIDTTGSMGDELEYLKIEIDDIVSTIREQFPNVDQQFALILYRDDGDQYVTRTFDFTPSLTTFRERLSQQTAAGGGNYPEAMHLALEQAAMLSWRDDNCARVMFLVADAPPHDRFVPQAFAAIDALHAGGVTMFPIAASGARDEAELVLRLAAFRTRGQYLFLTDHSGVGSPHAMPQSSGYHVERLNQLMIRMIASKLSGVSSQPLEIVATESATVTAEIPPPPSRVSPARHSPPPHHHVQVTAGSVNTGIGGLFRWAGALLTLGLLLLADQYWKL